MVHPMHGTCGPYYSGFYLFPSISAIIILRAHTRRRNVFWHFRPSFLKANHYEVFFFPIYCTIWPLLKSSSEKKNFLVNSFKGRNDLGYYLWAKSNKHTIISTDYSLLEGCAGLQSLAKDKFSCRIVKDRSQGQCLLEIIIQKFS